MKELAIFWGTGGQKATTCHLALLRVGRLIRGRDKLNTELIKTLTGLQQNPALVVDLYQQLFEASFWVLVQKPAGEINSLSFLTYPSQGEIRELPVFTADNRELLSQISFQAPDSEIFPIDGQQLWPRMLDIVKTKECEVAVDPGEFYGIRLTREMILGMVSKYGSKSS